MLVFRELYPGDYAIEFLVVVSLAISGLSLGGLFFSSWFQHNPAARHCILLAALACIVVCPILITTLNAVGITLISIPLPLYTNNQAEGTRSPEASHAHDTRIKIRESSGDYLVKSNRTPNEIPVLPQTIGVPKIDDSAKDSTTIQADLSTRQGAMPSAALPLAIVLWLGGSIILLLRLLRSFIHLESIRRRAHAIDSVSFSPVLDEVCKSLNVAKLPWIGTSSKVRTPVAFGVLRPCVIIPRAATKRIESNSLQDSLVHEAAHILRRDPLVVLVQMLASAVYWPIPFIHLLNRGLARAREEICDNHVLTRRDPTAYGETLLFMAELAKGQKVLSASTGILNWPGPLEKRIMGLINKNRNAATRCSAVFSLAVFIVFALSGGVMCCTSMAISQVTDEDESRKSYGSGEAATKLLADSTEEDPQALQPVEEIADPTANLSELDRPDFEQDQLDRWYAHYFRTAEKYRIVADAHPNEPFVLVNESLLNYADLEAVAEQHGSILLWTKKGRPQVVGAFWSATWGNDVRRVAHEFHSLTDDKLTASIDGRKVWYPRDGGIDFRPIPGAPVVAPTKPLRTAQLRRLVAEFNAYHTRETGERKLAIVESPIYRYQEQAGSDEDGAIFVFFSEQDPEALLLIETEQFEDGLRWRYCPIRLTEVPARMTHRGVDVWQVGRARFTGNFLNEESDPFHALFYENRDLLMDESEQNSDKDSLSTEDD